jgi:hypothetical protein
MMRDYMWQQIVSIYHWFNPYPAEFCKWNYSAIYLEQSILKIKGFEQQNMQLENKIL